MASIALRSSLRLRSPDTLTAWTFKFMDNGSVQTKKEERDDYRVEEWTVIRRVRLIEAEARIQIEKLEKSGWKVG